MTGQYRAPKRPTSRDGIIYRNYVMPANLLNLVSQAIMVVDPQGRITEANKAAFILLAYENSTLPGGLACR
jgi:PAS domain-containing protein